MWLIKCWSFLLYLAVRSGHFSAVVPRGIHGWDTWKETSHLWAAQSRWLQAAGGFFQAHLLLDLFFFFASEQTTCPCWLCLRHGFYGFSLRSGLSPNPNRVIPSKELQGISGQVRNCKHQDCVVLPNGCHRIVAVFLGRPCIFIRFLCIWMHIFMVGVTTACCWCELHWRVTARRGRRIKAS